MRLSITTNAKLVRMGLQNLKADVPKIGRNQIWMSMQRARRRAKIYPPERPRQKYVRTYRLRDNWKIGKSEGVKAGYSISNSTSYEPYVMGDAYGNRQAWMHKGRWSLIRDIMKEETQILPEAISKELQMVSSRYAVKA
jgi:hypothetical protein